MQQMAIIWILFRFQSNVTLLDAIFVPQQQYVQTVLLQPILLWILTETAYVTHHKIL